MKRDTFTLNSNNNRQITKRRKQSRGENKKKRDRKKERNRQRERGRQSEKLKSDANESNKLMWFRLECWMSIVTVEIG